VLSLREGPGPHRAAGWLELWDSEGRGALHRTHCSKASPMLKPGKGRAIIQARGYPSARTDGWVKI